MKGYISVRELAVKWECTEKWLRELCKAGRIEGSIKQGRQWLIPTDAAKPEDKRIVSGNYIKENKDVTKLPLPVGISDYIQVSTEYYYIDKTLLIKDIIDNRPYISLYTRPRRFGKTLNMDMLKTFFEKSEQDTSVYFQKMQIWQAGERYRSYQGKYPVIFISFKDVKQENWDKAKSYLATLIYEEFVRHKELLTFDSSGQPDQQTFRHILSGEATDIELESSLSILAQLLHKHHGIAPILIIDEYDRPIQEGYSKGYYEEVVGFIRSLLFNILKDNKHLSFAFLTGLLKPGKDSLYSVLNNINVFSVLDDAYSQYFGFTDIEVAAMTRYYGCTDKLKELYSWYDGYRFGESVIFNPWSVLCYFSYHYKLGTYWLSAGDSSIIKTCLEKADAEAKQQIYALAQGKPALAYVDSGVVYSKLELHNTDALLSFLLMTGYLGIATKDIVAPGSSLHSLTIPNQELSLIYKKDILSYLQETKLISPCLVRNAQMAMFIKDRALLQRTLKQILIEGVGFVGTDWIRLYYELITGLYALFDICYKMSSNLEEDAGYCDIILEPRQTELPGVKIRLRFEQDKSEEELQQLAQEELEQVKSQEGCAELKLHQARDFIGYGVAFSGEKVALVTADING